VCVYIYIARSVVRSCRIKELSSEENSKQANNNNNKTLFSSALEGLVLGIEGGSLSYL
jgi:hypothetical protein